MININNVSKSFKDKVVFKDLNLTIKDGSIFGLIGINGAGKSTLLRCISNVLDVDNGSIDFDGIKASDNPAIKKDIIFISDDPYFPISSNIESLKEYYKSFYDLDENLYRQYLELFGLNEKAPISSFSKGMKRQTILLFGMAISPKYLLLDECFDGLDPLVRLNFKKALIQLIEDKNITVIISSHNLKELEDICDSFGILVDGKVDTYGDLLESKNNVNKYQMAYEQPIAKDVFANLDVLDFKAEGRIVTLVVKGDKEETTDVINKTNPLLIDVLPVNFEELFIYEMEARNNE